MWQDLPVIVAEPVEKEENRVLLRKIADLRVASVSQGGAMVEGMSWRGSHGCPGYCRSQRNTVKMSKEKEKENPTNKQPVSAFSGERKVGQG